MKRIALLILLIIGCKTSTPPPAKQNPSPMVEFTRLHGRIQQRALTGKRFAIDGLLAKPVEVLVTPAAASAGEADLLIHFHGAPWLPMQAAEESGRPLVVAALNLGAGSGRYGLAFRNPSVFATLVERVAEGAPRLRDIYLVGFSAGYGAIREILKNESGGKPPHSRIAGVLLLDGLHTSYIPEAKPIAEGGKLDESKLEPFVRYGERAVRGETRFVITHSEIFPGTFASTTETADYLLKTLSLKRRPIVQWGPLGMQQLSEARQGSFVVLGFAGNSAPDHIDQFHGIGTFLEFLFK